MVRSSLSAPLAAFAAFVGFLQLRRRAFFVGIDLDGEHAHDVVVKTQSDAPFPAPRGAGASDFMNA